MVSYLGVYVNPKSNDMYLVMEYLAGGSLKDYVQMNRNNLSELDLIGMYSHPIQLIELN